MGPCDLWEFEWSGTETCSAYQTLTSQSEGRHPVCDESHEIVGKQVSHYFRSLFVEVVDLQKDNLRT